MTILIDEAPPDGTAAMNGLPARLSAEIGCKQERKQEAARLAQAAADTESKLASTRGLQGSHGPTQPTVRPFSRPRSKIPSKRLPSPLPPPQVSTPSP